jgi:hypothetical protein
MSTQTNPRVLEALESQTASTAKTLAVAGGALACFSGAALGAVVAGNALTKDHAVKFNGVMVEAGSGNVVSSSAESHMRIINKAPKNLSEDNMEAFDISSSRWFHSKISSITDFDSTSDLRTYKLYRGEALKYHNEKTLVTSDASGFIFDVDLERDFGRMEAKVEGRAQAERRALRQGQGNQYGDDDDDDDQEECDAECQAQNEAGEDGSWDWTDWVTAIACPICVAMEASGFNDWVMEVVGDFMDFMQSPTGQALMDLGMMLVQLAEGIPGIAGAIAATIDMIVNPSFSNFVDIILAGAGVSGLGRIGEMFNNVAFFVENSQTIIQLSTNIVDIIVSVNNGTFTADQAVMALSTLLGNVIGIAGEIAGNELMKTMIGMFLKALGVTLSVDDWLAEHVFGGGSGQEGTPAPTSGPGTGSSGSTGSSDDCEDDYECYVTPAPTEDPTAGTPTACGSTYTPGDDCDPSAGGDPWFDPSAWYNQGDYDPSDSDMGAGGSGR